MKGIYVSQERVRNKVSKGGMKLLLGDQSLNPLPPFASFFQGFYHQKFLFFSFNTFICTYILKSTE
jgi:hypothetical protein